MAGYKCFLIILSDQNHLDSNRFISFTLGFHGYSFLQPSVHRPSPLGYQPATCYGYRSAAHGNSKRVGEDGVASTLFVISSQLQLIVPDFIGSAFVDKSF
ncbi:hypothetical protein HAX54_041042 [Datura stramonium]|uniref:Uncharacterized protein n=1 Tax=Datura stramonium TaxID=4076 RepID=A0ABS8VPV0_DATST|nr:hypothetical protein [Datura stramonium]